MGTPTRFRRRPLPSSQIRTSCARRHQFRTTMIGRLLVVLCLLAPVSAWAQAPQNLTATGDDGEVSLTWEAPTVEEEDSLLCHRVYRDTNSIPDENPEDHTGKRIAEVEASDESSSTYADTDVTNGTRYFYRVTAETGETGEGAVSCGGSESEESSFSNEAMATPGPVTLEIEAPELTDGRTSDAWDAATSIPVNVKATNVPPDKSVQLRYRQGGEASFTSVPMDQEEDEFAASIPGTAVTAKGVEFVVTTRNNQGDEIRSPADGIASIRVETTDALSVTQPGGTAQLAYRMVSFPAKLEDPQLSNLFAPLMPYDPTEWRLFEIDDNSTSSDGLYVEQNNTNASLETGRSIWLISRSGATLGPVRGTSVRTDQPYEIPLQEGWNLIGNPFAFDVSRSQLRVENTAAALQSVFAYDGATDTTFVPKTDDDVLEPYRGYLVRLSDGQTGTLLVDPAPPESEASSPSTASARATWQVDVSARVDRARDAFNTFGVAPGASDDIDPIDGREPPPIGDYASLAFQVPTQSGDLWKDIRGADRSLHTWTARVETNVSGMITLQASGVESVPQDRAVWLVDPSLDLSQNLRETPEYKFPASGDETRRRLRFLAGTPSAVQQALGRETVHPQSVELLPPVPNPVRAHATLRYQVPEPTRVTLALHDLLGRRVATLVDDRDVEAGMHAHTWTPETGTQAVSSGTYLLRLQAGDAARTRRLVVVR